MKRTIHGEALQVPLVLGGHRQGLQHRTSFEAGRVWCPACGAAPNRKCAGIPGRDERSRAHTTRPPRYPHTERFSRAEALRAFARQGREALYRLAFRRPTQAAVRFERPVADLPLFSGRTP